MKKMICFLSLFTILACSNDDKPLNDNFITSFRLDIDGSIIDGEIDQSSGDINFGPFVGVNLDELSPAILYSEKATISPSEFLSQNFNDTVSYTVTAENGDSKVYNVNVDSRPFAMENEILSFSFDADGQTYNCDIDNQLRKITLDVVGLDLTSVSPDIVISDYATISPSPEVEQNFDNLINYVVTSEGGESATYEVDIYNRPISTERKILSFSILESGQTYEGVINEVNKTISIDLADIDIGALTPTLTVSEYATVFPMSNATQNFNNPVEYIVTSESGDVTTYTVLANQPKITYVGPYFTGDNLKFYTGAELIFRGKYINPEDLGAEALLSDGVNEYPLSITSSSSGINNNNQVRYIVNTIIPYNIPANSNYTLVYRSDDSYVEYDDFSIDVDTNGPSNMEFNQNIYSLYDIFIVNGTNLLPALVVPSNSYFFVIHNSNSYDIEVNESRTQLTWTLDYHPLFPSYYGDPQEEKKIYTLGEDGRIGPTITTFFD